MPSGTLPFCASKTAIGLSRALRDVPSPISRGRNAITASASCAASDRSNSFPAAFVVTVTPRLSASLAAASKNNADSASSPLLTSARVIGLSNTASIPILGVGVAAGCADGSSFTAVSTEHPATMTHISAAMNSAKYLFIFIRSSGIFLYFETKGTFQFIVYYNEAIGFLQQNRLADNDRLLLYPYGSL